MTKAINEETKDDQSIKLLKSLWGDISSEISKAKLKDFSLKEQGTEKEHSKLNLLLDLKHEVFKDLDPRIVDHSVLIDCNVGDKEIGIQVLENSFSLPLVRDSKTKNLKYDKKALSSVCDFIKLEKLKKNNLLEQCYLTLKHRLDFLTNKKAKSSFKFDYDKSVLEISVSMTVLVAKRRYPNTKVKRPRSNFKIAISIDSDAKKLIVDINDLKETHSITKDLKGGHLKIDQKKIMGLVDSLVEQTVKTSQEYQAKELKKFVKLMAKDPERIQGVYEHMDDEAYHKCIGNSRSSLTKLLISIKEYEEHLKNPWQGSLSTDLGKAFHCLVLTPDRFKDSVYVYEDIAGHSYAATSEKLKARALSQGKLLVKKGDYERMLLAKKDLLSDPLMALLIKYAKCEHSFFWDEETENSKGKKVKIKYKFRPDLYVDLKDDESGELYKLLTTLFSSIFNNLAKDDVIIFDLKYTKSIIQKDIKKSNANYGYHIQASHYLRGANEVFGKRRAKHFLQINVQSTGVIDFAFDKLPDEAIDLGNEKWDQMTRKLADYISGNYTSKSIYKGIRTTGVPSYMYG